MIAHALAEELLIAAKALPELSVLNRYHQLNGSGWREAPALVILAQPQKHHKRAGIVRVSLTVESNAADDSSPPNTHAARVALVGRLFIAEKDARIAQINARGVLHVTDWGQIPGNLDAGGDDTGQKLRSTLVLLVSARAGTGNAYGEFPPNSVWGSVL